MRKASFRLSRSTIFTARKLFNSARRVSWHERLLALEAGLWLGAARIAILILPLRRLAPYWGQHMAESPLDDAPEQREFVAAVGRALRTMSHHLPWRCKCLERALAGKMLLRRRGISNTLYLGVAKHDENLVDGMKAHAWLRSGSLIVTGAEGRDRFTIVASFADERR